MKDIVTAADYRELLETWIPSTHRHLYRLPNDPECICYGIGYHNHWALQAGNTAFGAFAALATDPETDPERSGLSEDEMLAVALGMFRFCVRNHHSGSGTCADGKAWGHSWISALCLERMMHGVQALDAHLTERDRNDLKAVLLSEADWLLDNYDIVAGLTPPENKPESNMWNGALLHRAATLYPHSPRQAEYVEKGNGFLVNAISVPSDARDDSTLGGKSVRDRHLGANFFENYACNHHGYLNIGYIVVTLSNAAMLHFFFRELGRDAPEALYHHIEDVWPLVKACTFPDGRLMRIGGDTRVRYCYCQDYAIPMWLMMRDRYGETDADAFEAGWLRQVAREQKGNPDGSFLGTRLRTMEKASPLYYTRLEGDRAVSLSMGAYWRRRFAEFTEQTDAHPAMPPSAWHDDYHGACLVRSPRRVASWVWRAAEAPQGLCLRSDCSSLAEWKTNLAGRVRGLGMLDVCRIERHRDHLVRDGFVTCGRVNLRSEKMVAEGEEDIDTATVDIAAAALPDGVTMVVLQRARTDRRIYLRELKGLMLQIPNDIHNGCSRTYRSEGGEIRPRGRDGKYRRVDLAHGWLCVDDCLGVVALTDDPLVLLHPDKPRVPIKSYPWNAHAEIAGGFLFVDEVCMVCHDEVAAFDGPGTLFDVSFAVLADVDANQTRAFRQTNAAAALVTGHDDLRAVHVRGTDGHAYILVANFGDTAHPLPDAVRDLDASAVESAAPETPSTTGTAQHDLEPGEARLLRRTSTAATLDH